jgi:4-amino-4-deoxy-L-arabinose transferase-like glycosyltransferase
VRLERGRRGPLVAVLILMAFAAAIRVPTLGSQSFWRDEGTTVSLLHMSFGKMWATIPNTEATPPLYYSIAWVWVRVAGLSEAGLRSFSVACGVLTVPVAYRAATVLVSRAAGFVTGLLVAVNPLLIWYSQEGRAYALLVLLASWSFLFFVHSARNPTVGNLAVWALASMLAIATHYFALFLVIAEAAWLLKVSDRRRVIAFASIPWVAALIALAPLAVHQRKHADIDWIAASGPLAERLKESIKSFFVGINPPVTPWTAVIAGILVLGAFALLLKRDARCARSRTLPAVAVSLIAFGLVVVLDASGFKYLDSRNVIACLVPSLVAVAAGLTASDVRSWISRQATVVLLGLCALSIGIALNVFLDPRYQKENWRQAIHALGPAHVIRIVVAQRDTNLDLMRAYMPHFTAFQRSGREVTQVVLVDASAGPQAPPIWPGFRLVSRRRSGTASVYVYAARKPVRLTESALQAHRLERGQGPAWIGVQLPS